MKREPLGLGSPLEERPDALGKPHGARRGFARLKKSLRPTTADLHDETFRGDLLRVAVPLHAHPPKVHLGDLTQGSLRRLSLCSPILFLHSASAPAAWLAGR